MTKTILFVDDDINLINGLRRSIRGYVRDWELHFATSGQEALMLLSQHVVDVIVSDMRMPGMDGGELLEIVSEKYPNAVRFILSGHTDQEMALRSSNVAHQFIAKPCDTSKLVETIQHSLKLRELQTNPQLVNVVTSIKKLPSLPSLYIRLVEEMESPDVTLKSLADIIANDMTMTAKVLQLVNSAFYGLPTKITNLPHAVAILGINTLKMLVLGMHIFSEYSGYITADLSIEQLWDHSIGSGNLARLIARNVVLDISTSDDSQVAGVMHDIGKLLELNIPDFYADLQACVKKGMPVLEAEYELLGTSHAELGAYLLGIWGLPDTIVQAVAYHHYPSRQAESHFSALTAVHVANGIINQNGDNQKKAEQSFDMVYLNKMGLDNKIVEWENIYQGISSQSKMITKSI
jgi:HD-like signal output (HDOD) protein/CheY-like chemotaxis protein